MGKANPSRTTITKSLQMMTERLVSAHGQASMSPICDVGRCEGCILLVPGGDESLRLAGRVVRAVWGLHSRMTSQATCLEHDSTRTPREETAELSDGAHDEDAGEDESWPLRLPEGSDRHGEEVVAEGCARLSIVEHDACSEACSGCPPQLPETSSGVPPPRSTLDS